MKSTETLKYELLPTQAGNVYMYDTRMFLCLIIKHSMMLG